MSHLWKPNVIFCFWDQPTVFLATISKDVNVLRKSTFFNKMQQIQFANRVKKKQKT